MSDQRLPVIVLGNCQAQFLCHLMSKVPALTRRFSFHVATVLAEDPLQAVRVPDEMVRAVVLFEQYDQRASVPLRDAVLERIPDTCRVMRYPAVSTYAFWPFWMKDPRNRPEPGFPFGRYSLGDRIAHEVADLGLASDVGFERYLELSRSRMPDLEQRLLLDCAQRSQRDAACDIKIGDFVSEHLRSRYQFWTHGHLSTDLYAELLIRAIESVPNVFGAVDDEMRDDIATAKAFALGQGEMQLPIHSLVIEQLGLGFVDESTRYRWYGNLWTFEEFTKRLIAFDRSWER